MWKVQLFIFVEAILLSMALVTMLAADFSRVVLIMLLFLLFLYYYFGKQRGNSLLVATMIVFFFIVMLNPFVIAAVLFTLIYGMIVAYPYLYKENQETHLFFEDATEVRAEKNRWLGDLQHFSKDDCQFHDINLLRMMGKDTIHLEDVIVVNHDNVIVIRKGFGDTKIVIPLDVEIQLQINSLYGDLNFLNHPPRKLRNETISLTTPDYKRASKTVKIVLVSFLGNVEVVRK